MCKNCWWKHCYLFSSGTTNYTTRFLSSRRSQHEIYIASEGLKSQTVWKASAEKPQLPYFIHNLSTLWSYHTIPLIVKLVGFAPFKSSCIKVLYQDRRTNSKLLKTHYAVLFSTYDHSELWFWRFYSFSSSTYISFPFVSDILFIVVQRPFLFALHTKRALIFKPAAKRALRLHAVNVNLKYIFSSSIFIPVFEPFLKLYF